MSEAIITAIITGLSSVIGIYLLNSRQLAVIIEKINQLEKKQDKHNQLIERMFVVETKVEHIEQELRE